MDKIKIVLSTSQRRDDAMREQGISPARLSIKPGVRVEKSRKVAAKHGQLKHKKEPCPAD